MFPLCHNLIEASRMFHLRGTLWWRKFMIPAVFPYIVTGIISAAGGAWNAAIASELITWGKLPKRQLVWEHLFLILQLIINLLKQRLVVP